MVLAGLPGVGECTIARELARTWRAMWVRVTTPRGWVTGS